MIEKTGVKYIVPTRKVKKNAMKGRGQAEHRREA